MTPLRVLVVDDVADLRGYLAHALERRDCRVETAGDAAEALARCAESRFDLILLDERLPDGPGSAAVPVIKRLQPSTAIILMSGSPSTDDGGRGLRSLPKPVDFAALETLLSELRGRRDGAP